MPITEFLSCTSVSDEFESLSPAQRYHAKTYATGLVAASNKTVAGIARKVLSVQGKRALNKFLTEYDWDEQEFNHERLEKLRKHGETRWSQNGYIILDDTITEKAGDFVPGVVRFYDHAEGDSVWGQDLIYAFYADDKTAYPLTYRPYEKQDEGDQDHDTKYDLVREIVTELEEEVVCLRTPTSSTRSSLTILAFLNISNPTARTGSARYGAIDRQPTAEKS